ncbi:hypothetical protein K402DRAFT_210694 [Aulographum hederae CBS 113979]|uniref:Mid2 domain-containing protein n=1 Tax=Aulographum hederae CBS 113979 TaxID=1176131 RepID=A0A6G1GN82_9PEZI|nr:hypothetical protein K402DRAFT_210694 [Aulographum hederae CBS 113979]
MKLFVLIFSVLSLSFHQFQTAAQCWYPDGDQIAEGQRACDPDAETSACCPWGWTCFSNKLCMLTDTSVTGYDVPVGTVLRGTCTDWSWSDDACADFCTAPNVDRDEFVTPCGDDTFCCQSQQDGPGCDCVSREGTFSLESGLAQTIIGLDGVDNVWTSIVPISFETNTPSSVVVLPATTQSSILRIQSQETNAFSSQGINVFSNQETSVLSSTTSHQMSTLGAAGARYSYTALSLSRTTSTALSSSVFSSVPLSSATASPDTNTNGTAVPEKSEKPTDSIGLKVGLPVGIILLLVVTAAAIFRHKISSFYSKRFSHHEPEAEVPRSSSTSQIPIGNTVRTVPLNLAQQPAHPVFFPSQSDNHRAINPVPNPYQYPLATAAAGTQETLMSHSSSAVSRSQHNPTPPFPHPYDPPTTITEENIHDIRGNLTPNPYQNVGRNNNQRPPQQAQYPMDDRTPHNGPGNGPRPLRGDRYMPSPNVPRREVGTNQGSYRPVTNPGNPKTGGGGGGRYLPNRRRVAPGRPPARSPYPMDADHIGNRYPRMSPEQHD